MTQHTPTGFTRTEDRRELDRILMSITASGTSQDKMTLALQKCGFNEIVIIHPAIMSDDQCTKLVKAWKAAKPRYDDRGFLIW